MFTVAVSNQIAKGQPHPTSSGMEQATQYYKINKKLIPIEWSREKKLQLEQN